MKNLEGGGYRSSGKRITADWPGRRYMLAVARRRARRRTRICHQTPAAPAASNRPRPSRIPRISRRTAQFLAIISVQGRGGKGASKAGAAPEDGKGGMSDREDAGRARLKKSLYEAELAKLRTELVKLQDWVHTRNLKVVALFEQSHMSCKNHFYGLQTFCLSTLLYRPTPCA